MTTVFGHPEAKPDESVDMAAPWVPFNIRNIGEGYEGSNKSASRQQRDGVPSSGSNSSLSTTSSHLAGKHKAQASLTTVPPPNSFMWNNSPRSRPPRSPQPRPPSKEPPPIPTTAAANTVEVHRSSIPSTKSTKAPSTSTASSSQHSFVSGTVKHRYNPDAHPPRRLRSQFPRGSPENHVEYILVASFDVDRGPVMEHQYPVAITGDEHMLAELMLPDQTHLRNQDWTMFFLHKDMTQEEEEQEQKSRQERLKRRKRKRDKLASAVRDDEKNESGASDKAAAEAMDKLDINDEEKVIGDEGDDSEDDDSKDGDDGDDDDDDQWSDDDVSTDTEPEGGEGAPLIYVLNLVNTKQDKREKRGAVVKAMAICTRHPFLHIYKPLLLLALEEYFKSPVPETLSLLYDAVNAMDLSLMPRLSLLERHLLQASDNKDLFVEKFEQMIQMRIAEEGNDGLTDQPFDASRSPPKRPGISRSGTKAHFEGQSAYSLPRDTHEFESKVLYKGIPIPIKVPVAAMPETVGDFSLIKLIQNFSDTHNKSPQPFPLHAHLTTNGPHTHPIIVLVNALLTQKRIIFLGHNMPSGEVAEAVLAACALASGGVLRGFTRHAFPYTDLTKIDDLLLVPGFIAGVTNPTFEMHPEWWDLLCDLPSGRMKISSKIEEAPVTEGMVFFKQQHPSYASLVNTPTTHSISSANSDLTGDNAFMADILKSMGSRLGERVIRAKWRDWVVKFTRIAAAFEETVYGASVLNMGTNDFDTASNSHSNSNNINGIELSPTTSGGSSSLAPGSGNGGGHGYVWADENAKQRELAGNVTRVEGWRNTRSYLSYIKDVAQMFTVRPLKGLDLHHMHDRLRTQRLTLAQSRDVYLTLARSVHSYDEICLLLSVAPESHGGLFYIALGLFHKDRDVRVKTSELLERLGEHEAGRHWWNGLSRFAKFAFVRIRREAEAEMRSKLEKEGLINPADAAAAAAAGLAAVSAAGSRSGGSSSIGLVAGEKRVS